MCNRSHASLLTLCSYALEKCSPLFLDSKWSKIELWNDGLFMLSMNAMLFSTSKIVAGDNNSMVTCFALNRTMNIFCCQIATDSSVCWLYGNVSVLANISIHLVASVLLATAAHFIEASMLVCV